MPCAWTISKAATISSMIRAACHGFKGSGSLEAGIPQALDNVKVTVVDVACAASNLGK